jgi:tetratricopeptide (TPR) repeat protein
MLLKGRGFVRRIALFAALIAIAPTSAAIAQPPTIQQQFDAATAALDAHDWAGAVRGYEALEARIRNPRTLAIARTRRATALVELGRSEEAATLLRDSLPVLSADDASLNADRVIGFTALGQIAESRLDYEEALRQYRQAYAIAVPDERKLPALRGLIQTQLFTNADGALGDADTALRAIAASSPNDQPLQAKFHTLRGRALLNLGRFAEAQAELELAMRQLGDLTLRADINDLVARSDLAIAALLAGDGDRARRYLAYTGAGRLQRGAINPHGFHLPPCGGDLSPDDVAVVQLGIADDGRVTYAMPIYASRQGAVALAFARAARDWAFYPRPAGEVPSLLRAAVRIEMRCSDLADPDGEVEDGSTLLPRLIAFDRAWADAIAANLSRPTAAVRASLAEAEAAGVSGRHAALPLLLILADRDDVPFAERSALVRRALAVATAERAPDEAIASIAIAAGRPQVPRVWIGNRERPGAPDYEAILAYPEVRLSPRITAMIRLAQARRFYYDRDDDRALLTASGAIRALPDRAPTDPLLQQARQLLVVVNADRGDMDAARAAHQAMGPGAPRCGLAPRHRRNSAGSSDFPDEAVRWGFEGWAMNELALTPQGEVAHSRTVMAYPAFVFGEASRRVTGRTRHEPTYVPDGAACTYDRQAVRFALPG